MAAFIQTDSNKFHRLIVSYLVNWHYGFQAELEH